MAEPAGAGEVAQTLRTQLRQQIEWFERKRRFYRRAHLLLSSSTILLSVATTVLIAHMFRGWDWKIAEVTLACSSATTALFASAEFFGFKDTWVRYSATLARLQALRIETEVALADSSQPVPLTQVRDLLALLTEASTTESFDNITSNPDYKPPRRR